MLVPPYFTSCYRRLAKVAELSAAPTAFSAFLVLQSRISDRGAAKGSFSVLFVRSIAMLRRRASSPMSSLSHIDGDNHKSRRWLEP
jgi:hypothetical protein